MITGNGINTVTVNGKVKHITELDDITLCLEWTKLREENNRLYEINNKANRGWRGFILRLIGVNLPDKRTEFTQRLLLTRKISGSVNSGRALKSSSEYSLMATPGASRPHRPERWLALACETGSMGRRCTLVRLEYLEMRARPGSIT